MHNNVVKCTSIFSTSKFRNVIHILLICFYFKALPGLLTKCRDSGMMKKTCQY